jgi:hypothetical protein
MPYELRVRGGTSQTFDTEEEAVARAHQMMQTQPGMEAEIWDTTTGKPAAPGASKASREELTRRPLVSRDHRGVV